MDVDAVTSHAEPGAGQHERRPAGDLRRPLGARVTGRTRELSQAGRCGWLSPAGRWGSFRRLQVVLEHLDGQHEGSASVSPQLVQVDLEQGELTGEVGWDRDDTESVNLGRSR
jgi:hypothetical protein